VAPQLAAADQEPLMDVTVARLNGIMAQVPLKGLTAVPLAGIMALDPLKEHTAVLLPGVMALVLRLEHVAARLAGVTAQAPLPARMEVQHPGAGECLMELSSQLS